ncbi:MAG: PQQ-dependent sugar dehydrogenase, partial [Chloroflexota bacterium]|nr:PQQ-dependent sugar dehydrogenase [Chloroflexota bacterium]
SELVLIDRIPSPAGNHNAGDLNFGKDGYLYVSVGDGGCDYKDDSGCAGFNDASRDKNVLLGKILRVKKTDGTAAPDNPWMGADSGPCRTSGRTSLAKCQETFAWGLRNPFRFAFNPNATGTVFRINDVGQNEWEEIDASHKGADYGWNCREGKHPNPAAPSSCPSSTTFTNPIYDYSHSATGCGSITGGAFVPNGVWPAAYNGSYLYSDYVCGKIFRLYYSDGAYRSAAFASGLGGSSAVHLRFGPYGPTQALYYTTYASGGEIRRVRYTANDNRSPSAVIKTNTPYGLLPLTVNFDGTGSRDPEGGTLSYEWDFTGNGTVDARTAKASYIYQVAGTYNATLRVRDPRGATASTSVKIYAGNTPPAVKITSPAATHLFRVGETITLRGSATDAQDGTLASSRLRWQVIRHHATHTHPFLGPVSGNNITFTAPAPEDLAAASNSYLELRLTATDSKGLSRTVSQRLNPHKVKMTWVTRVGSSGATLQLEIQGVRYSTPKSVISWEGYRVKGYAPTPQSGRTFVSWGSGSTLNPRTVTTPDRDLTYTAIYR